MNLPLLAAYTLAVFMLILTPGPVVALVTGTAARHGSRKAFVTLIGTNAASLVLIAFAAMVLAGVVALTPFYLSLLGLAGSLFIGWGAVNSLQRRNRDPADIAPMSERGGWLKGFLIGVSNPKDILFFVSFFPQFMAITQDFTASIMTLSLVWIILDFAILAASILTVNRWVPERHGKLLDVISSLFLLAVALFGLVYNTGALFSLYEG
ncbi:Homoserine/homoserine lactone efflux protein [Cedecea lapagei]|uniref:Homoserine/homoserine lactone efflux protein n=1 Tax=Cedecea lapagei TaxID=158823 RepID=A0A3S5DPR8_9ENTR|nr:LysE family translocator [Cedecea lapagei]VEB97991.1 Homoserine/homoserine lactone efflux protein [Cedecea lapagei]